MWVGALRLEFFLSRTRSLKDKRQALQQIRDRVLSRYDVAAAEVGDADDMRQLVMGFSTVGNDQGVVRAALEAVAAYVDSLYVAPIARQEIAVERFRPAADAWIPDDILVGD